MTAESLKRLVEYEMGSYDNAAMPGSEARPLTPDKGWIGELIELFVNPPN
jgi:hypothetical protein